MTLNITYDRYVERAIRIAHTSIIIMRCTVDYHTAGMYHKLEKKCGVLFYHVITHMRADPKGAVLSSPVPYE